MHQQTSRTHRQSAARDPKSLFNQRQTAALIGVSERTLECWRCRGSGPPFVKISRRAVRYRRKDIDQWVRERLQRSTAEEFPIAR